MSNLYRAPFLPLTLPMPTTGHTPFLLSSGAFATWAFPPIAAGATFDASLAGTNLSGIPFVLRAAGTTKIAASTQYQIDIAQVNASNALLTLATTGLLTAATGNPDNWLLEISGVWDSTSRKMRGSYSGFSFNATSPVVSAAVMSALTSVDITDLVFCVAVTVTTVNAMNSFGLTDFTFDFA